MSTSARQAALELLSEPFATVYGFCHACVIQIQRLEPNERIGFLICILENYGLVPLKKTLFMTEHLLSVEKLDQLEAEQNQNLEILYKATATVFPPTEEFAKYLLGAMDAHKTPEEKALVIRHLILRQLLPYAPVLPKASKCLAETEMEKAFEEYPKEAAAIKRLFAFGTEEHTWCEVAEILMKILAKKPDDAQILLLALFLTGLAKKVTVEAARIALEEFLKDNEVMIVAEEDGSKNPPKNGN
ncbi:hypothetical protein HYT45_04245 [Candidatus Uhrbacteria bacterium]|nr:hypothetical protein [Candidatus Uhrbacteria bacterium]